MRNDCDKNGHACATCLNYQLNGSEENLNCNLSRQAQEECEDSFCCKREHRHWKQDTAISLPKYACIKSQEIFGKLKAKIFNVLEAQIPFEPGERKLNAAKRLTEDIISNIAEDVKDSILKAEVPNKTINT